PAGGTGGTGGTGKAGGSGGSGGSGGTGGTGGTGKASGAGSAGTARALRPGGSWPAPCLVAGAQVARVSVTDDRRRADQADQPAGARVERGPPRLVQAQLLRPGPE